MTDAELAEIAARANADPEMTLLGDVPKLIAEVQKLKNLLGRWDRAYAAFPVWGNPDGGQLIIATREAINPPPPPSPGAKR